MLPVDSPAMEIKKLYLSEQNGYARQCSTQYQKTHWHGQRGIDLGDYNIMGAKILAFEVQNCQTHSIRVVTVNFREGL